MRLFVALTVSAGLLVGCLDASPLVAGARRAPTISISSVTYSRAGRSVDFHVRLCLSNGPRAILSVAEQRTDRGVQKASNHWVDPTGVDLTRIYPYSCAANYLISWALKPRFAGPGTYTATIRVRDGYGTWSAAVSFSAS